MVSSYNIELSVRVVQVVSSGSSTMLNTNNRKEDLRCNNALLCQVSLTSISWTGWHRINYHMHWVAYCYINSLRQPHCTART